MHSMIEQVKEAEQQAAQIRQEAVVAGREAVAKTQADIKEKRLLSAEEEREALKDAMQKAEETGAALGAKIISERAKEADASCEAAKKKLPEAVAYLLGRVVREA